MPLFSPYQKDFAAQELPSAQKIQHVESVDGEEQGQPQRSYEQQEKNVHEKARQQHTLNKAGDKNKYEPCQRWKTLDLLSAFRYVIIPLIRCALQYCQATTYCAEIPFGKTDEDWMTEMPRLHHMCSAFLPAVTHYKEMVIGFINFRASAKIPDYTMI